MSALSAVLALEAFEQVEQFAVCIERAYVERLVNEAQAVHLDGAGFWCIRVIGT
ncbi:hypothetical protein JQ636_38305 [Bradyrhizobium japonicum]|uniref:hypothetical protein n=1 Tax=Bradyrhizobium japonicum TaxID=375 RepID=UPI001BA4BED1|nr:hypothetical protein [Bradyrhizobium japonicum]MBR0735160.1 hypothetical protein [Bradyrhizobium japonicum]MBR0809417.1 hypothetical protein [Bradyrhizobium japonicum]